ncbi:ComEC/Rec2 family competence protein [Nafulsella turpanensis]|uniref:ComEC/Rec2 family competence protein n=1 Tax=Nafulsella turpanensis TaxID=1265690 RepID=UPI00034D010A|nr:ComEC/Rec2 family competence protein [Nafulsella turpanensis]
MYPWAAFPFLRYVLWLIAGILAGLYFSASTVLLATTGLLVVILYVLFYLFRRHMASTPLWNGLAAFLLLFTLGFLRMEQRQETLQVEWPEKSVAYWLVEARQEGLPTAKTVKVPVRLLAYREGDSWLPANSSLMLYIRKDSLQYFPSYGDRLLVKMEPVKVPDPLNPNTFNYRQYMATQGICCQAFVRPEQVKLLGSSTGIRDLALEVRLWASRQMDRYLSGPQETAIANALVLGYRELLDEEINRAYSTAGAMHVLAVSGLHVGFIFFFLQLLFRPWRRHPWLKWLGFVLSLLVLWSYAFVTGLSPSVLRSVIMFSLVMFALQLKRRSGIYNTLALAAFVMLLYDPFILRAVGFQLSFLAVFGIVYLQPRFAEWYQGKNKAVRWLWNLLAVSLAAQLATFPLGLYYFGQFPTYFFLTNLIVVPASSAILGLGFLLLACSLMSPFLAEGVGWLLELVISLVNKVVFMAEVLPYSAMETSLSQWQLVLLLLFLLLALLFLHFRHFFQALLAVLAGVVLVSTFVIDVYQRNEQKKLLLYHIPGYSVLQLVAGRQEYLHTSNEVPEQQLAYTLRPNRIAMGLNVSEMPENTLRPALSRNPGYDLLVWEGQTIAYVKAPLAVPCPLASPLQVNYVVLSHNAVKDLELLSCYFRFDQLLIDGSNQNYIQNRLQQQAESLNLSYHLTSAEGAFELNL